MELPFKGHSGIRKLHDYGGLIVCVDFLCEIWHAVLADS